MSAPFPDHDFLDGAWLSFGEIAGASGDVPSANFPALSALYFDRVKDSVCAFRGWGLCSVDAVTIADDGRIFLIEFKDTNCNPIAWLKKKGFDSLFLFWIAAGQNLTMEEIRDRAVFCYVNEVSDRYDDELGMNLESLAGMQPIASSPDQLEELYNSGLYGEVRHLGYDEFAEMINGAGVALTIDDFKRRVLLHYQPQRERPSVPRVLNESPDFKRCVMPIAELRMQYPFDQQMHRKRPNEILRAAGSYHSDDETVSWRHDWGQMFPAMNLIACSFDTFLLWCLSYHDSDRMDELGGQLKGSIEFCGEAPKALSEPSGGASHDYRHRFWEIYHQHYRQNFGLSHLEHEQLYGQLRV